MEVIIAVVVLFLICVLASSIKKKVEESAKEEGRRLERQALAAERFRLKQSIEENEKLIAKEQKDRERAAEDFEKEKKRHYDAIRLERASIKAAVDRADKIEAFVDEQKKIIALLEKELVVHIPQVADLLAESRYRYEMLISEYLATKSHPAVKAAEVVKKYASENKSLYSELLITKQMLTLYESYLPWGNDYSELTVADISNVVETENCEDSIRKYLTNEEYMSLSTSERNQLALDRYVEGRTKTKWQIGRDYELYVGHLFQIEGYRVEYSGSLFRFDDLGRDLVVRKGNRALIVQCKYWSKEKEIHEKHIFQLFGTSMCYQIDHPEFQVSCVLVTNTVCSETARAFARKMSVALRENIEMGVFPRVKCNISEFGERIYHLPMDQQYDNVVIEKKGEFFAMTVQEAVDHGFRRAYRWHGA